MNDHELRRFFFLELCHSHVVDKHFQSPNRLAHHGEHVFQLLAFATDLAIDMRKQDLLAQRLKFLGFHMPS